VVAANQQLQVACHLNQGAAHGWQNAWSQSQENNASLNAMLAQQNEVIAQLRRRLADPINEANALLHPKVKARCLPRFESGHYEDAIVNAGKLIETEVRRMIGGKNTDYGVTLITKAMNPKNPRIKFSDVDDEQRSAYFMFCGLIGWKKNPRSHRYHDDDSRLDAFEIMQIASHLMRRLDAAVVKT
jgi:uncharacterized protein (TIGR02391 family)